MCLQMQKTAASILHFVAGLLTALHASQAHCSSCPSRTLPVSALHDRWQSAYIASHMGMLMLGPCQASDTLLPAAAENYNLLL